MALASAAGLALFLVLVLLINGSLFHEPLAGNFYAIFPHNTLALMFGFVFLFAVMALGIGVVKFWRGVSPPVAARQHTGQAAVEIGRAHVCTPATNENIVCRLQL